MQSRIQKWGNGFGLRIPMQAAKELHLRPGSSVDIEIENGRMIIRPLKHDLDLMLKSITPKNRHHQMFDIKQRGKEEL